jgi:hypothetical protein
MGLCGRSGKPGTSQSSAAQRQWVSFCFLYAPAFLPYASRPHIVLSTLSALPLSMSTATSHPRSLNPAFEASFDSTRKKTAIRRRRFQLRFSEAASQANLSADSNDLVNKIAVFSVFASYLCAGHSLQRPLALAPPGGSLVVRDLLA